MSWFESVAAPLDAVRVRLNQCQYQCRGSWLQLKQEKTAGMDDG